MPVDFFVGALMTIYSQAFKIHKCDQYAPNFMEENCGAFPMADGLLGAVILLGAVGLEYDSTRGSAILKAMESYDSDAKNKQSVQKNLLTTPIAYSNVRTKTSRFAREPRRYSRADTVYITDTGHKKCLSTLLQDSPINYANVCNEQCCARAEKSWCIVGNTHSANDTTAAATGGAPGHL